MPLGSGSFGDPASHMDFRRERRDVGQCGNKIVALLEKVDLPIVFTLGGREEDAGMVAGAKGDVGAEPCAAAGFLDD